MIGVVITEYSNSFSEDHIKTKELREIILFWAPGTWRLSEVMQQ